MAFRIDRAELVKSLGDPWTPDDANLHPRMSDQVQGTFGVGHTEHGIHRMPAAQACAVVRWTGSAYTIIAQSGGVSVLRFGVGRVRIAFSGLTFDGIGMPAVSPFDESTPVGAVEVAGGTGFRDIQIGRRDKDNPDLRTPIDCSFVVEWYGPVTHSVTTTPPVTPRYRIAQDDVLDVELINRVSERALGVVESIAKEHRIFGPAGGDHNIAPVPLAARLYTLTGVSVFEDLEPTWSYGLWHDDSGWPTVAPGMWVYVPEGCKILSVRAFAAGVSVDDVLRVDVERDSSRPRWRIEPAQTRLSFGTLHRLLVVVHGVRG
ncbi:MAG TPA: hypothetical protein VGD74_05540 [Vulgatibacter sp.]